MFHDKEEWCKIWREIDLSFQNWHEKEFDKFWPEHKKISKIWTLISSFWTNYIIFEVKIYRRVIFHDNKEWCKIWRKPESSLVKWHEEFAKFLPEHSKASKMRLWLDPFIQSRKCMSLKFTEEYCVMTMRNDAKFEDQLTCSFNIDMRNLTNEEWCKTWRKTDLWFGKWNEKFSKFLPEHTKVSKLGLRWDPFIQSRKCMRLKLCVMTMYHDNEEWYKIWRGIDSSLQN